jgi:hypothetical protein
LLDDPRFNRNYDFVFYGFKTTFHRDLPEFEAEAAKLDRMLTHLEEDYKSITIVTHSNGGLVAMRALLNRAKDFPAKQPHKIHRIVMFTPLTENVSLTGQPDIVKLLGKQSTDVAQMQANTSSKLNSVKQDLKALLDPQDPLAKARAEAFMKDVAEHIYIVNAEGDKLVDVGPNGEKIVSETVRMLSQLPTLGAPRLVTLRYSDIGGKEEDARERKSGAKKSCVCPRIVVKMGCATGFLFLRSFRGVALRSHRHAAAQFCCQRRTDPTKHPGADPGHNFRDEQVCGRQEPDGRPCLEGHLRRGPGEVQGRPGTSPDKADRRPHQADVLCLYLSQLVCTNG